MSSSEKSVVKTKKLFTSDVPVPEFYLTIVKSIYGSSMFVNEDLRDVSRAESPGCERYVVKFTPKRDCNYKFDQAVFEEDTTYTCHIVGELWYDVPKNKVPNFFIRTIQNMFCGVKWKKR